MNEKNLNFKQARILYIEYYIDFEWLIFELIKIKKPELFLNKKDKISLSDAIDEFWNLYAKEISFNKLKIRKNLLKEFKNYRNKLAHEKGIIVVNFQISQRLTLIKIINIELTKLIKK